jgi:type I site-specific restriction endonuclease
MKKSLSERDICTKYITPALQQAGWDSLRQIREEVTFTAGRVIVRGKLHTRGQKKRADYILYHKANLPIALIEAKDNTYSVGAGMQQALAYAEALDIPFIYSSNGDAFMEHESVPLKKRKAPVFTEARRRPSIPSPLESIIPLENLLAIAFSAFHQPKGSGRRWVKGNPRKLPGCEFQFFF